MNLKQDEERNSSSYKERGKEVSKIPQVRIPSSRALVVMVAVFGTVVERHVDSTLATGNTD